MLCCWHACSTAVRRRSGLRSNGMVRSARIGADCTGLPSSQGGSPTMKTSETAMMFGVDIGKNVFHVLGLDVAGRPVFHWKFRRDALLRFFVNAPPATIGMESCPGSQWLARKLQGLGHIAKLIPAQFVKPFVKSNKNDMVDTDVYSRTHNPLVPGSPWRAHRTAFFHPLPNTPPKASLPPHYKEKVSPMCPVQWVTYVSGRSHCRTKPRSSRF